MKQTERIIKTGDYYEVQLNDQLFNYQKYVKKDQIPVPTQPQAPTENIIINLPTYSQARSSYFVPKSIDQNQNKGLAFYQEELQNLLKQPLKDEQTLQINKLLQEIDQVKNYGEVPLNQLPQKEAYKPHSKDYDQPKKISLQSEFSLGHIQKQMSKLENLNMVDLSRLEFLLQILLGEHKQESGQNSEIDEKVKQQIESLYGHTKNLTSINNIQGLVEKMSASEPKFLEMKEWSKKTESISNLNKELKNEFQSDQLILNQLQANFKQNLKSVREIIEKLKNE